MCTLADAGGYITTLPKPTQDKAVWQNAVQILIQSADHDGPIEFARIGMMQALSPKGTPVYHSVYKDPKWRNSRKLTRDQ